MATYPCPHCGQPVEAEHVYCPHCSRSLRLHTEPPPEVQSVRQPSSKGLWWVVGIGVAALLAMFVLPMILLPSVVKTSHGAAQNTACLSNMKQLAVGHLIYMSDYDDHMVPDANFKPAVMPYIKNNEIFACPNTRVEFAVNDDLLGKEVNLLLDPAATVMLYEGYQKVLSGPHGGKSSVAYADSHARQIMKTAPIDFSVKLEKPVKKAPAKP